MSHTPNPNSNPNHHPTDVFSVKEIILAAKLHAAAVCCGLRTPVSHANPAARWSRVPLVSRDPLAVVGWGEGGGDGGVMVGAMMGAMVVAMVVTMVGAIVGAMMGAMVGAMAG